jgi:hypothetical protein
MELFEMDRTIVTVTLEDKAEGGLFVYSDDLPGLILSGPDAQHICDCIIPAIEAIFRHKGFADVHVHSEKPLRDVLKLASPRSVDMHVQRFIVEFKHAA